MRLEQAVRGASHAYVVYLLFHVSVVLPLKFACLLMTNTGLIGLGELSRTAERDLTFVHSYEPWCGGATLGRPTLARSLGLRLPGCQARASRDELAMVLSVFPAVDVPVAAIEICVQVYSPIQGTFRSS
jgi:hypothetical protein